MLTGELMLHRIFDDVAHQIDRRVDVRHHVGRLRLRPILKAVGGDDEDHRQEPNQS